LFSQKRNAKFFFLFLFFTVLFDCLKSCRTDRESGMSNYHYTQMAQIIIIMAAINIFSQLQFSQHLIMEKTLAWLRTVRIFQTLFRSFNHCFNLLNIFRSFKHFFRSFKHSVLQFASWMSHEADNTENVDQMKIFVFKLNDKVWLLRLSNREEYCLFQL
jgi:hypothetical protein